MTPEETEKMARLSKFGTTMGWGSFSLLVDGGIEVIEPAGIYKAPWNPFCNERDAIELALKLGITFGHYHEATTQFPYYAGKQWSGRTDWSRGDNFCVTLTDACWNELVRNARAEKQAP